MADEGLSGERPDRPVLAGLLALVGVGLVVGLVLGGVALGGVRVLGLGGSGGTGNGAAAAEDEESFYLPPPLRTDPPEGPLITLVPEPTSSGRSEPKPSKSAKPDRPKKAISLSAGQTQVAPMQQIDLTGVYPGGEGAILQVQRFADGAWQRFEVTAAVTNETFATYVQTGRPGVNRFRVVDTSSGRTSNQVRIRVG
ncbi:hypothetical protein [Nocardioides sp. SYSU DS0663]|uniref:hypothetical protein n=1 Tax=Nocardioides sp. SYSU DS0663 TaxID=3416445 RepID=UPI003F4B163E